MQVRAAVAARFMEGAHVREHLVEVQKLRSERGVPLLDPADPRTKERYGL
jgi:hypothetical protein